MNKFSVFQITVLSEKNLSKLLSESEEEGYHFVTRLWHDYQIELNLFNKYGGSIVWY